MPIHCYLFLSSLLQFHTIFIEKVIHSPIRAQRRTPRRTTATSAWITKEFSNRTTNRRRNIVGYINGYIDYYIWTSLMRSTIENEPIDSETPFTRIDSYEFEHTSRKELVRFESFSAPHGAYGSIVSLFLLLPPPQLHTNSPMYIINSCWYWDLTFELGVPVLHRIQLLLWD